MNAIGYAEFYSRSHRAVLRLYDEPGNVIQTLALTVAAMRIRNPDCSAATIQR